MNGSMHQHQSIRSAKESSTQRGSPFRIRASAWVVIEDHVTSCRIFQHVGTTGSIVLFVLFGLFVNGNVGLSLDSVSLDSENCGDGRGHFLDFVRIDECVVRVGRVFACVGPDDVFMQCVVVWEVGRMLL